MSLNLYTYCHNEPVMYYDPTGHVDAFAIASEKAASFSSWSMNLAQAEPTMIGETGAALGTAIVFGGTLIIVGAYEVYDFFANPMVCNDYEWTEEMQSQWESKTKTITVPDFVQKYINEANKTQMPSQIKDKYIEGSRSSIKTETFTQVKSKPTILTSPNVNESQGTILTFPTTEVSKPTILTSPNQTLSAPTILTSPGNTINGRTTLTSPGMTDTGINVLPISGDVTSPLAIYGRMQNVSELDFIGGEDFKLVKLPQFGYTGYRKTFFNEYPYLEGENLVIHHGIEQQVFDRFKEVFTFEEIQDITNLRGIPVEINSEVHLSKIRKIWDDFYADILDRIIEPTKENFLKKREEIDDLFGDQFKPKIR